MSEREARARAGAGGRNSDTSDAERSPAGDGIPASREAWEERLRALAKREQATSWELGDLLAAGAARDFATYREMAEMTGYDEGHIKNLAYVARNVASDDRRSEDGVSWGAHKVVAPLEPSEQRRWLARAAETHPPLPAKALREEIAADREPPEDWSEPSLDYDYKCPRCRYEWSGHPIDPGTPAPEAAPA